MIDIALGLIVLLLMGLFHRLGEIYTQLKLIKTQLMIRG